MRSYRFTVKDGSTEPTTDIAEFDDAVAARGQAVCLLGELLRDADGAFWQSADWRVDVADETGLTLYSLTVVGIEAPAAAGHRK